MLDGEGGKTPTLLATNAYQDIRRHVRLQGGSMTYVDVGTAVQEARETWGRMGGLIRALTQQRSEPRAQGGRQADVWALLEILRPIRYIGVASQAEAQGVRTEAFVVMQDLP
jgi:hypothetical protein